MRSSQLDREAPNRSAQRSGSNARLRLALVVPRFGENVWGGAELHGRWLAERLAGRGHEVDVFTTCALDHRTWLNELPAGVERYGPLLVRRFPTAERDLGIHAELDRAITSGVQLSLEEEQLWLRHGVSSEAMEEALAAKAVEYDAVLALPYLFGTTYFAYTACPDKAILIPCLHNEPFAYLGFVRDMLSGARGIMFNTDAEARFAGRVVEDLAPWGIVAVGFDPPESLTPQRRRRKAPPSLLYVGRREAGKNTPLLVDYFRAYRGRRPDQSLRLVMSGSGDPLPAHPDIVEMKADWRRPYDLFRDATIFCLPSTNESLSIVLLRAWLAERPVLVHGACAVTREHCERSNGGLWFTSYGEFEEVLDRMLASDKLRDGLARNGRAYVEHEYSWSAVLDRFDAVMAHILGAKTAADLTSGTN